MNHFNENDKYISSIVVMLASIEGLIITISSIVSSNNITVLGITFVVTMAILLFLKQQIVSLLIKLIKPSKKKRKINSGEWLLNITFEDETPTIQGHCTMQHSVSGVKIFGGKLLTPDNQVTRKEKWISENVEILNQNSNDILIYLYKTPSNEDEADKPYDEMTFDKVGLVVATRRNGADNIYEGTFRDFPLTDDQDQRQGRVTLTPIN
jgi:hypothetical protein